MSKSGSELSLVFFSSFEVLVLVVVATAAAELAVAVVIVVAFVFSVKSMIEFT